MSSFSSCYFYSFFIHFIMLQAITKPCQTVIFVHNIHTARVECLRLTNTAMCVCQCRYRHHTSAFPYSIMIMYDIFIIITVIGWKRRRLEFASLPVYFVASHMIRSSLLKCHQIYHIHGMKKRSCIANMLYRHTVAILCFTISTIILCYSIAHQGLSKR